MHVGLIHTETELVDLLKEKNPRGFSYLYDEYAPVLYCIVMQTVRDEAIAQEVIFDVFITICREIHTYDNAKAKLLTWMMQIARNAAIAEIRSSRYQQFLNQTPTKGKTILIPADHIELDNYGLKKIIKQLDDEQRMMIDLSYFRGLTHDEISQEMSVASNLITEKLKKALSELRKLLCK